MNWLVAALALCVLVSGAHSATGGIAWCYHDSTCNDATWPTIAPNYCNGSRQSPIDLVSASAQADSALTAFTFHNFSSTTALKKISNTGKTVKVELNSGVRISGGGLSEDYEALQFHLHWGNGPSVPGSEHTVNGKRYAMELHIVNIKASHNGNITKALADPTGFAALGFLIEVMSGDATGQPASWHTLSSYLANITNNGDSVNLATGLSLNDLLPVDNSKYYRYLGSLTTPTCNEAVVWTVFKETVNVSADVIELFAKTVHIGNSSTPFATNTFRNLQGPQPVTTQAASAASNTCCSQVGLMALSLVLWRSWSL